MVRVFLDANVILSGAHHTGVLGRLLAEAARRVELVVSEGVVEEARRNLALKRPMWLPGLERLLKGCVWVPATTFHLEIALPDADRAVLCTACRGGCAWLVTGDRQHFGAWFDHAIEGVEIMSTLRFAERLRDMPPLRRS